MFGTGKKKGECYTRLSLMRCRQFPDCPMQVVSRMRNMKDWLLELNMLKWPESLCLSSNFNTFFQIQQINSRQLWKHLVKNMKNLYKWKFNHWKELKTLRQKVKLLIMSNFTFCQKSFKSQKSSACGKGLIKRGHFDIFFSKITWIGPLILVKHYFQQFFIHFMVHLPMCFLASSHQ